MILVTGGTGLLGSHLIFDLLKTEKQVVVLKHSENSIAKVKKIFNYYTDKPEEFLNRIKWVDGDVLDYYSLLDAMQGVTQIYHCAALVSFSPSDKQNLYKINVSGTANVVNAALEKNIDKLLFVSSIGALGSARNGNPIDENSEMTNSTTKSDYSISKYFAELEVYRGINEGLNAVIVNPSVILGANNWNKNVKDFFSSIWSGLNYYTLGTTGFVDVRDVSKAMILLMNSEIKNERFILNSENRSYKELFNFVADSLNKNRPKLYASPFLTNLAWRYEFFKKLITEKKELITKYTARNAHCKDEYSNKKIVNAVNYKFIPVKDTINYIADIFLKQV
ncbi:MAG: NAD-dependent epimerase/dehydratase family protein [Bacteroidales bacterium]|nr:NAD-dependent epimerase/dehydratase family protein [Bacteroidales bacterium]